jgi:hypothetical protein
MPPAGLKLLYPVKSTFPITQRFGENPQWYPLTNGHNGIDWGIPLRTPVYAALPGKVVRVAADNSGYGNHIRISHDNNLLSLYGHLDERHYALVKVDDMVEAGQHIGFSGNTGRSTGPHLHFEVREGSTAFDPEPYLSENVNIPPAKTLFKARVLQSTQPFLNIRSGPGTLYPVIGKLNPGDEVEVIDIGGETVWLQTKKGFIAFRMSKTNLAEVVVEEE